MRVSNSILKLTRPAIRRGTFQCSCRATTCVVAAVPPTATAMSQAVLPYPTTTACRPVASAASCRSEPAHNRPPAETNASSPVNAGIAGSQNTPLATISRSYRAVAEPVSSRVSTVQPPSSGRAAVTSVDRRRCGTRPAAAA